jgi:hypothetical protein
MNAERGAGVLRTLVAMDITPSAARDIRWRESSRDGRSSAALLEEELEALAHPARTLQPK